MSISDNRLSYKIHALIAYDIIHLRLDSTFVALVIITMLLNILLYLLSEDEYSHIYLYRECDY